MLRWNWLVLSAVAVVGCSAEQIATRECGNEVAELGEDCDSRPLPEHEGQPVTCASAGETNECRYTCNRSIMTSACPNGWQCGTDDLCHHASGHYQPATALRTPINGDIQLGDVDGDGQIDVLVSGIDEVHPLFSDGDGTFTAGRIVPMVFSTPSAAVGDIDDDGRIDVISGSFSGFIQFHGQTSRTLLPFAQPAFAMTPPGIRRFPIQIAPEQSDPRVPNQHMIALNDNGIFSVSIVNQENLQTLAGPLALAQDPALADLAGVPARADLNADGAEDFALAFTGRNQVFVFRPVVVGQAVTLGAAQQQTINLPVGTTAAGGVKFVDTDNDGDRDLLIGIDGNHVAVAKNGGNGAFGAATVDAFFDGLVDPAVGGNSFPFTPINLGGGPPGWINDFGVFRNQAGVATLIDFNNTFLWSEAVVDDFNHDGLDDFAAVVRNKSGLDVFLQTAAHLFAHTRVVTAKSPTNLRVGDFDGDGTADLVYRESAESNVGPYSLAAAFGSSQGLTTPVPLGDWVDVVSLEPMSIFLEAATFRDGVTDLLVQGVINGSGAESVTFLYGSYQRVMLAPYEARAGLPPKPVFANVSIIGRFNADPMSDVALITVNATDLSFDVAVAQATGNGNLNTPATNLLQATPFLPDTSISAGGLGFGCSTWSVADLDGNGIDDLVGVTRDDSGFCLDAFAGQVFVGMVGDGTIAFTQLETGKTAPARSVQLADINNDGQPELLVIGDGRATVYFREPSGTFTPVQLPTEHGMPLGMTVANADSDPEVELVVSTSEGLVIYNVEGQNVDRGQIGFQGLFSATDRIVAVDVNGDRIEDILIHDQLADEMRVLFAIPHDELPNGPPPEQVPITQ